MNSVTIHFKMKCTFPNGPLDAQNTANLKKIAEACVYLQGHVKSKDLIADASHFSDLADVVESLANITRRVKATSRRKSP